MVTDCSATQHGEPLAAAKDRIRIGPVPGWVDSCPFRIDFEAKAAGHVTYLLFDRQIHAELGQTYHHVALRLDTMQAVQNESPWRLDFEPRHQQITLHSIKTCRSDAQFDHANLSSARVVDRQAAGSALQDRLTLLLMLEDVRPGDVLEWCYTVESQPKLLPEHCASIFTLPAGATIGKFYFSLFFNSSRPMRWKCSVPEWQPVETRNSAMVHWICTRENYPGLRPEENTPGWFVAHPWIQISDCPDWGTIAAAFAEEWKEDEDDPVVRKIAGEIAAGGGSLPEQAGRAIRLVQDEFRYLAIPWELDGQVPVRPGVVARRRYGDCKDLSFLLVHLLKRLGIPARLVLINTVLRKSIADLLPAPGVFNHLLVECQLGGETHWVDATLKRQGGGSLNQAIRDYGAGLAVDAHCDRLVEPPAGLDRNDVYSLKQSILLDTSGAWSRLAVVVAARGSQAEALRQELESGGLETLAKKRLRLYADRFKNARRVGSLEYRDDRAANEFFLAEIFEIKDFLTRDPKTGWFKMHMANDYAANFLKTPETGPRRAPFALPHPCNISHTIELHSVALPLAIDQQRSIEKDFMHFTWLRKTTAGCWSMRLTLSTLADAVPPESVDELRATIKEIRARSAWSILVPAGEARSNQRGDFGALPVSWDASFSMPAPAASAAAVKNAATPSLSISAQPQTPNLKGRKRRRRRHGMKPAARWHVVGVCAFAVLLIVIMFLGARYADRWHVFKRHPEPPPSPLNSLPVP